MAISVTWGTKVINVPQADMTALGGGIYELDLNQLRLDLKALEASEEGMAHLDTHSHNTEIELSGVTYARFLEFINGYTVTFEDNQYAVNAKGANSNIADVMNVNQVSLRTFNSAGLITVQGGTGSGASASDIWSYVTRNLTGTKQSFDDLNDIDASDVWGYGNKRLSGIKQTFDDLADMTAADVWTYFSRTLTGSKNTFDDLNDVSLAEIETALEGLECSGGGGGGGSMWVIDSTVVDHFPVVDVNTGQLVSGIDSSSFEVFIYDPLNCNRVIGCGGDSTALSYEIYELETTGVYKFIFTPDMIGVWVILVKHSVYFPAGKSVNYNVASASSDGGGGTETVTNEDLLVMILGLY